MNLSPYWLVILLLICLLTGCNTQETNKKISLNSAPGKAQAIIDKAIAVHGGEIFNNIKIAFDFRDKHYEATRRTGLFTYTRAFSDSTGQVKDVLTNQSLTRKINNKEVKLPAERMQAFTESVNSVIYFALLPFGLNDPAVEKELLGNVTIREIPYYKIKVTFQQENGGSHFQDQFLYWINQKTGTVDYFAYTEGGIRFRQAINPQVIGGIRFQDYINYKTSDSLDYLNIDKQFEAGSLKEISRIELKNIKVNRL